MRESHFINTIFHHYPRSVLLYHSYIEIILSDPHLSNDEIMNVFKQQLNFTQRQLSVEVRLYTLGTWRERFGVVCVERVERGLLCTW